jgi:hypothetical protein
MTDHEHCCNNILTEKKVTQLDEPTKSPEQRIEEILAEGYVLVPTMIGPVLKSHTPVVEFLGELIAAGWQLSFRVVREHK